MSKWKRQRARMKAKAKERVSAAGREDRIQDECCVALACLSYASEAKYLREELPTGWRFLDEASESSGYDAAALLHTRTRTLVILNRGTEWSEKEDLLQNAANILTGEDAGQIEDALAFASAMWSANTQRADEIKVIGHSLGGGLAEAQVCLAAAAMRASNVEPPRDIFGIGVASAGYRTAIEGLAAKRRYAINTDTSDMTHYVRKHDVVEDILLGNRMNSATARGSIFYAALRPGTGKRARPIRAPFADGIHNHDCASYFEFFNVGPNNHIFWRWGAELYEVRDGDEPEPYPNGQMPEQDF